MVKKADTADGKEELEAVRNHLDQVPLTLLGELRPGRIASVAGPLLRYREKQQAQ